ncbi:MAG: hypothetical protein Kow0029_04380 [Candidatus Rifleibacteriota bacterium]
MSKDREILTGIMEVAKVFAFLFALILGFTKGFEYLLDHFSRFDIIMFFFMLVPAGFIIVAFRRGKMRFSEKEIDGITGAANFVLFFVFFGSTAWISRKYHIEKIGIPAGIVSTVIMLVALNKVEGMRIKDLMMKYFLWGPKKAQKKQSEPDDQ